MIQLRNDAVSVTAEEDGSFLALEDVKRGVRWMLDPATMAWGEALVKNSEPASGWDEKIHPLRPVSARLEGETLRLACDAEDARVEYRFALLEDGVEATLLPCPETVQAASLPGVFRPEEAAVTLLLPLMQGVLWEGGGPVDDRLVSSGHHDGFSMAMFAQLAPRGALLVMAEDAVDALYQLHRGPDGDFYCRPWQIASLGQISSPRRMRLCFTDASVTAAAKRYRQRVIEKGRFLSWEEKLAERPALSRLFGSLMCFIGYCHDELDYPAEFAKLKAAGFDRALIYPVRMNSYDRSFRMGGEPPIWLPDGDIEAIKALGYDVAPWTWINEGRDDGTAEMTGRYRLNRDGERIFSWQIDDYRWFKCCPTAMEETQKQAEARGMGAMTWDHFDVLTCAMIDECFAKGHAHAGPMSRTEALESLRRTLLLGQDGKRAISSENFNDLFSREYDLGSVKAWPLNQGAAFRVVPLTSLVYHDSLLHTWWEPHNYNINAFTRTASAGRIRYSGGRPALMSAWDALSGGIPDVMPFGAQYGWTGRGSETYIYRVRFEDAGVQEALRYARPVAGLHRRIGMLEMTDLTLLDREATLQQTTFADGTVITANFAPYPQEGPQGLLPAESWQESRR